jgi:hypothetical protein
MSYNMQAEGLNGVSAPTNIAANNWSHTTSPAPVLKVDAFQQFQPHNLTALECAGSGTGAGVIGRSERGTAMIGAAKGDAEGVCTVKVRPGSAFSERMAGLGRPLRASAAMRAIHRPSTPTPLLSKRDLVSSQ